MEKCKEKDQAGRADVANAGSRATLCPPLSTESAGSFLDVQNWGKNEARSTATSPHVSRLPGSLIRYLSHRRFHVMLSALDPWVWNPANPYVRHHWKFQHFWGVDFRLHTQDRIPALPKLMLQQCYWLPRACRRHVSAGEQPPAPRTWAACPLATHSPFPLLLPLLVWNSPKFQSPGSAAPELESPLPQAIHPQLLAAHNMLPTALLPREMILFSRTLLNSVFHHSFYPVRANAWWEGHC